MFEIELKFAVEDVRALQAKLESAGAVHVSDKRNEDTYYNHPCKDFAQTGEAFRVRREDNVPMVTYKGPKLPGKVKAREELEWRLDPGDPDGQSTERLLVRLGFRRVATVSKNRQTFRLGTTNDPITITLDDVEDVGTYAEVERVLAEEKPSDQAIQSARDQVVDVAKQLGLGEQEPRSYLTMLLQNQT